MGGRSEVELSSKVREVRVNPSTLTLTQGEGRRREGTSKVKGVLRLGSSKVRKF